MTLSQKAEYTPEMQASKTTVEVFEYLLICFRFMLQTGNGRRKKNKINKKEPRNTNFLVARCSKTHQGLFLSCPKLSLVRVAKIILYTEEKYDCINTGRNLSIYNWENMAFTKC